MSVDEGRLQALLGQVYDAASDPERWPAFLLGLSDSLGGREAILAYQDLGHHCDSIAMCVRMDPQAQLEHDTHYAAKNVFMIHGKSRIVPGVVLTSEELCPDDVLLRSEFYNDYLRRWDMHYTLGGCLLAEGAVTANCILMRPRSAAHLRARREVALMQRLAPHIRQAFAIHRKLRLHEAVQDAAVEVLDRLPLGALMLDTDRQAVLANRRAREVLAARDGLECDRDGLRAACSAETGALRRAVADACRTAAGVGTAPGGAVVLSRPSGDPPLQLLVSPLATRASVAGAMRPAVVVFISEPGSQAQPCEDLLRRMYGLTRAEARVAALLVGGRTAEEITGELEIALNTARTHIKRVLEKTGARSQSDLLRRLLQGPAALRPA